LVDANGKKEIGSSRRYGTHIDGRRTSECTSHPLVKIYKSPYFIEMQLINIVKKTS